MICRDCARGKPSHLYQVDPKRLLLAIPVTFTVALFGGWLLATVPIGFFGIFLGYICGMCVAEILLRLTGRKRGIEMEVLSGGCALIGALAGHALHIITSGAMAPTTAVLTPVDPEVSAVSAAAVAMLINPWTYVTIAADVFGAVTRVRNI